ncbi:Cu(I)-responsive transcriptional regulator [Faunimonas pinastri]|uniref:Cu(I)-responsive transcriptional regulator n=1 Tax=Faunimonas pinastri TaxID=1855383 RepID=A0A1H9JXZ1_9HYPH|nr:Cu(I)-responsive transcriptional regulator [Faunimonas pinastri]SEQ91682.1 Cu(I)-responsive transcriptional regulator [Faunimonas pinastri]
MQIGEAARASGVSAKMIRHYEAIGLVPTADRRDSGYRDYADEDLSRLRFIRHSRDLGFPIEQIRVLLRLWTDRGRSNAEVKALARTHLAELEGRIVRLREMADVLQHLADACDGDGRPDCPILAGLEAAGCDGSRAGNRSVCHPNPGAD